VKEFLVSMPLVVWNVSYWVWHPGCGVHAAAAADICVVAAGWRCAAQLVDGTGGRNYFLSRCVQPLLPLLRRIIIFLQAWDCPAAASMVWSCSSALACRIRPCPWHHPTWLAAALLPHAAPSEDVLNIEHPAMAVLCEASAVLSVTSGTGACHCKPCCGMHHVSWCACFGLAWV
jgi:hypothetical protein